MVTARHNGSVPVLPVDGPLLGVAFARADPVGEAVVP
jgi:hypothetical protein